MEADAVAESFGDRLIRDPGLAVGDVLFQPFQAGICPGDPLEVVQKLHGRRDLLIDLGGERDGQDHVADASMPGDGVVDYEQDACHVAAGEDELARGTESGGLDLGPPQPSSGSFPQLGMAPLDLALQTEDTQLLGRARGRRQAEKVQRKPRVLGGLLARSVDQELSPPAGDERGKGDQGQEKQDGVDHRQQEAGQTDRHRQARQRQHGIEAVLDLLDLLFEHGQPVGDLGPLLVLDAGGTVGQVDEPQLRGQRVDLGQLEVGDVGEMPECEHADYAGGHGETGNPCAGRVAGQGGVGQPLH